MPGKLGTAAGKIFFIPPVVSSQYVPHPELRTQQDGQQQAQDDQPVHAGPGAPELLLVVSWVGIDSIMCILVGISIKCTLNQSKSIEQRKA